MVCSGRKIAVLALATVSVSSFGQIVTLANGGSLAQINAGTGTGLFGLNNWTIGAGPNNVAQQLYLIKVGGVVNSFNQLSAPVIVQPTADLATITYTSGANSYDVATRYLLTGAAPNSADLAEVLTLTNRGTSALTFTLYEYDNFTPGGNIGGIGNLLNSSTIRETSLNASITVGATPIPSHWMIDTVANVQNTITAGNNLTDGTNGFTSGSLAFAFQWDVTVQAGQNWQMSKDKLLAVPEPASMLTLGGLALLAVRRRRARKN